VAVYKQRRDSSVVMKVDGDARQGRVLLVEAEAVRHELRERACPGRSRRRRWSHSVTSVFRKLRIIVRQRTKGILGTFGCLDSCILGIRPWSKGAIRAEVDGRGMVVRQTFKAR
jgi:hypothetical protein